MSASHFGSGFWSDDYFGLYFQPEAGGVVIGTLSGSFAGTSSFAGTLEQPANGSMLFGTLGGRGFERRRKRHEEDEDTLEAVKAAYAELTRELPEPDQAAPVVAAVAAFVAETYANLPPLAVIDWMGLEREKRLAEIMAAIAETQRRIDEEDEDFILLMAA
jgi:hypothetical protein